MYPLNKYLIIKFKKIDLQFIFIYLDTDVVILIFYLTMKSQKILGIVVVVFHESQSSVIRLTCMVRNITRYWKTLTWY